MAKKINIAAELNAATVDGKLADASQIYDSKKGKFQEKFNEEIEAKVESYKQKLEKDVTDAVANLVGGASETFDTLKEFEDWVNNDKSGAAAIAKQTNENKTAISDLNANTGISEYPAFDPAVDYAVGDVVIYEGRLRRFVAEHEAGEWIGTDAEAWSERKEVNLVRTYEYRELEKVTEEYSTINTSGTVVSVDYSVYRVHSYDVIEGEKYILSNITTTVGAIQRASIVVYDMNDEPIEILALWPSENDNTLPMQYTIAYTVPKNAHKIRFSNVDTKSGYYAHQIIRPGVESLSIENDIQNKKIDTINNNIGNINESVGALQNSVESINKEYKVLLAKAEPIETEVGYIAYSSGTLVSTEGRTTKTYTVEGGDIFYIVGAGHRMAGAGAAVAMYDDDDNYLKEYSIPSNATNNDKRIIIIPDIVKQIKISYADTGVAFVAYRTSGRNIQPSLWAKEDINNLRDSISRDIDSIRTEMNSAVDIDSIGPSPLSIIRQDGGYTAIFRKIGVIGGSMSTGFHGKEEGSSYGNLPEYSFIQFMARICGSEGFNFSSGGISARTWLTNNNIGAESDKFKNNPCQLYIVQLGNNDFSIHENDNNYTLGSLDDISIGNESSNPDTFYGNLSKILAAIKSVQPRAYIFISTFINGYETVTGTDFDYNAAIREIVEYYRKYADDEVRYYLIDYFTYGKPWRFFRTGIHANTTPVSHLTATGYWYQAKEYSSYIDYIIKQCMADFNDVAFVGTDNYNIYSITYSLSGVTSENSVAEVKGGFSYHTVLSSLNSIKITMGGVDITNSVYYPDTKRVDIPNVWGNVEITAAI